MPVDHAHALQAVRARDRAADGTFVVGVVTTGVYCRPTCAGLQRALERNLRVLADVGEAQAAGLRACLRCDPDAARPQP